MMAETAFISPTVTAPSGLHGRCRQLLVDRILTARHLLDTSVVQRVRQRSSEQEFQSQLSRARSADLIQRIEAATLAATSERRSQHLGRLAE